MSALLKAATEACRWLEARRLGGEADQIAKELREAIERERRYARMDEALAAAPSTAPQPIDESAEREAFEQSQIAARMAEGWQNEDAIRKHYLVLRKDGHWQDLTTYQRWEGWLVAKRHAASVGVRLSPDQARSILEGVPATPDNGLRDDVIETLAAIAGMPQPSTASAAAQDDPLHVAVCQAVTLLNGSIDIARSEEGREARDILRRALMAYSPAQQPASAAQGEPEGLKS